MKRTIAILLFLLTFSVMNSLVAQPPPPPPDLPGNGNMHGGKGQGGNKGPSPVGTADILLITLAAAYAAHKSLRKKKEEE